MGIQAGIVPKRQWTDQKAWERFLKWVRREYNRQSHAFVAYNLYVSEERYPADIRQGLKAAPVTLPSVVVELIISHLTVLNHSLVDALEHSELLNFLGGFDSFKFPDIEYYTRAGKQQLFQKELEIWRDIPPETKAYLRKNNKSLRLPVAIRLQCEDDGAVFELPKFARHFSGLCGLVRSGYSKTPHNYLIKRLDRMMGSSRFDFVFWDDYMFHENRYQPELEFVQRPCPNKEERAAFYAKLRNRL